MASTGDASWDGLRGLLMIGGTLSASYFGFAPEQVGPVVDNIIMFSSSGVALGSLIWLLWVKYRTKAVPVATVIAAQLNPSVPTIPTVSPITGAVKLQLEPSEVLTKL